MYCWQVPNPSGLGELSHMDRVQPECMFDATVNVCEQLLFTPIFTPWRPIRAGLGALSNLRLGGSSTSFLIPKEFLHILDKAYGNDHSRTGGAQKKDEFKKVHGSSHKKHDRIVARLPFATRLKSEEMLDSRR
jgi:hypothetical protein